MGNEATRPGAEGTENRGRRRGRVRRGRRRDGRFIRGYTRVAAPVCARLMLWRRRRYRHLLGFVHWPRARPSVHADEPPPTLCSTKTLDPPRALAAAQRGGVLPRRARVRVPGLWVRARGVEVGVDTARADARVGVRKTPTPRRGLLRWRSTRGGRRRRSQDRGLVPDPLERCERRRWRRNEWGCEEDGGWAERTRAGQEGRAPRMAARLRRVRGGGGGSRVARDVGGGAVSPLRLRSPRRERGGEGPAGGEIKLCSLQLLCRFTHRAVPPISARIQPQQIRQLIEQL